jgi:hypothetical protein
VWSADYEGDFMLADRRYCYPLTIIDFASRYLFACEALSTAKEAYAFPAFEATFKGVGPPKAKRTPDVPILPGLTCGSVVVDAFSVRAERLVISSNGLR